MALVAFIRSWERQEERGRHAAKGQTGRESNPQPQTGVFKVYIKMRMKSNSKVWLRKNCTFMDKDCFMFTSHVWLEISLKGKIGLLFLMTKNSCSNCTFLLSPSLCPLLFCTSLYSYWFNRNWTSKCEQQRRVFVKYYTEYEAFSHRAGRLHC